MNVHFAICSSEVWWALARVRSHKYGPMDVSTHCVHVAGVKKIWDETPLSINLVDTRMDMITSYCVQKFRIVTMTRAVMLELLSCHGNGEYRIIVDRINMSS